MDDRAVELFVVNIDIAMRVGALTHLKLLDAKQSADSSVS
jgi:hypothetical protein